MTDSRSVGRIHVNRTPIRVAIAGFGWMGEVHARAYTRVLQHFPSLALAPELVLVADANEAILNQAAGRFSVDTTRDWKDIAADESIGAVSICAPNFLHREIAEALASAGKHLWIEKPVGLTALDATSIAEAVEKAGVRSEVGFNYRNAPAIQYARELIGSGSIGTVTNAHIHLHSDFAAHPAAAFSWRFRRDTGGAGVLADLASHGIDLARYLLGDIDSLVSDTAVFIHERPKPTEYGNAFALSEAAELGTVENEDFIACLLRFRSGAHGTLEASRVAVSEQCNYGLHIQGTKGALRWDFRRMGELGISLGSQYLNQPTQAVFVGPGHGDYGAFQPAAGVALSFDDLKVIEAATFLRAIAENKDQGATIVDAVQSAIALEAMLRSSRTRTWESLIAPASARSTA